MKNKNKQNSKKKQYLSEGDPKALPCNDFKERKKITQNYTELKIIWIISLAKSFIMQRFIKKPIIIKPLLLNRHVKNLQNGIETSKLNLREVEERYFYL